MHDPGSVGDQRAAAMLPTVSDLGQEMIGRERRRGEFPPIQGRPVALLQVADEVLEVEGQAAVAKILGVAKRVVPPSSRATIAGHDQSVLKMPSRRRVC
jgi:hypothetical protein